MDEWDEDVHFPTFSTKADSQRLEGEEANDVAESTSSRFSRDVLRNSSAQVSDDSDVPQGEDTIVVTRDMSIVQEGVKTFDQYVPKAVGDTTSDDVHMTVVSPGIVNSPAVAPHAWSTSFAHARNEALRQKAEEKRFSWMTEADQHMLQLGLEPVSWDHFVELVERRVKDNSRRLNKEHPRSKYWKVQIRRRLTRKLR
jgi:hypothetical protein